jgi:hypothetical protein
MKVVYRGPCEEMYGKEIEYPDHDCREHAVYREATNTETHGLDCGPYEQWTDRWYECSICSQVVEEGEEDGTYGANTADIQH